MRVDDVETGISLNDTSIRLSLSSWDSTLLSNLASFPGMMISPTAYKAHGDEWCRSHPVGTGPFKLANWQRDVKVRYEKFDGYWQKGKPYLDAIEINIITDPVTRLAAFKRGEVDDLINVLPADVKSLNASGLGYMATCNVSPQVFVFLGDSAHPDSPLADIRVRQAIEHAVDKQALADTFTSGLGKICNQYAAPGAWGESKAVRGYAYDPARAKKLLAEAGYPNGLKIKLLAPSIPFFSDPLKAVQGYLEKVGITGELEINANLKHMTYMTNGWRNAVLVHNASLAEPDTVRNLSINFSPRSPLKGTVLMPTEYEEALAKALAAGDLKAKQKWTWEAQKLMVDKFALASFFFTQPRLTFVARKVHNTGVGDTVDAQWTPEDAWLDQ